MERIPVGISSCLLGKQVRFDGDHKYNSLINTQLARLFEFRPCCPEVAIGLGVPREPVQLVRTSRGIRIRGVHNPKSDFTWQLELYGSCIIREFEDMCGYIFKARSPSCGIKDVATWTEQGDPHGADGTGAFAAALIRTLPDLPVTDENQLQDPQLREQFITRVFSRYHSHPH